MNFGINCVSSEEPVRVRRAVEGFGFVVVVVVQM